jgi:predicted metalloprotease with PDZ domain
MRPEASTPRVIGVAVLLFLVLPVFAVRSDAQVLRYVVRADPFEVQLTLAHGAKQTAQPQRETTHFYFLAEQGWPVPEGAGDKRVRCVIRWEGFPADWRLANSFGIDRRTQDFSTTLGELRKAVFAGGDFRSTRSKEGLFVVTRGVWKFPDSEVTDLLDRIAKAQTDIWSDRGLSGHLVFLLTTDKAAGQWGGEARTQAMVLELSRDTAHPSDAADGFAHELFHTWNARRLNRTEDERLYWFTEGVTEYYGIVTLWRSGIWSFERVLNTFNTVARQYFGSPVRNYTADQMVERRKSDFNAERLPYLQGFLLTAHWNTDGRTMDRVLRNLMKSNRNPLSNQRIAAALSVTGLANAGEEIERFVVRGETIQLRPRIWGECATESTLDVRQFDIGFHADESKKTGIIQHVREGGTAWEAGVRNGQRWSAIDVVWGDPGYLAELEIRDGERTRRVKYYPASSDAIPAPQYTPTSSRGCDPRAQPSSTPR